VSRTFPLYIGQVRVEVSQDMSDVEAASLLMQVKSALTSATVKVQDELQRKYPSAQLKLTLKHD
jgi:hypothetical protein